MQRESISIALSCGLGAFIGSLLGLESASYFGPHLQWWCGAVGMLAGGIFAYVAIDFRHFRVGVARAYRETLAWRPDSIGWKTYGYGMLSYVITFGTLVLYGGAATILFSLVPWRLVLLLGGCAYMFGLFLGSVITSKMSFGEIDHAAEKWWYDSHREYARFAVRNLNPVVAPFWLAVQLFKALRWICLTAIPFIAIEGIHFVKQTFIYVHSTRRTICFVDAGLGAIVGFASGNAVIGAIVGGMLGVVNYELVAVWWLKLPVRR